VPDRTRIAVVTAREFRGVDPDEPLLLAALARAGAEPVVAAWDDPAVAWEDVDLAVVRSAWDYALRRTAFLAWATATGRRTRLRNAPEVLAWGTDKAYLAELAARGVPVVPTTTVQPGDEVHLPDGPLVVKPTVSAGGRDTARYADGDPAAADHVRALLAAGRTALVQPYQDSVDARGERALMHVGGRFAWAAAKSAILVEGRPASAALQLSDELVPAGATAAERAVAEAVLDAVPFPRADLLYARVDLVHGPDGSPLLLELELVEPSMFLEQAPPGGVDAFAQELVAAARR
jgi:glutathione synthase/RimK-type ligase-like ATP-grasp enzyme